jgi:hypothetical protein
VDSPVFLITLTEAGFLRGLLPVDHIDNGIRLVGVFRTCVALDVVLLSGVSRYEVKDIHRNIIIGMLNENTTRTSQLSH